MIVFMNRCKFCLLNFSGFNKIGPDTKDNVKGNIVHIGISLSHLNVRVSQRGFGFGIDVKPASYVKWFVDGKINNRT